MTSLVTHPTRSLYRLPPPELTEPLLEIERTAGQKRAKIPAHVTMKDTIYGITILYGMIEIIREIAGRHKPFQLATAGMKVWDSSDSLILGFEVNPEIQVLHDELVSTVSPLGKPAYKDDPLRCSHEHRARGSPAGRGSRFKDD
jgi:hypothetical protein